MTMEPSTFFLTRIIRLADLINGVVGNPFISYSTSASMSGIGICCGYISGLAPQALLPTCHFTAPWLPC